MNPKKLLLLGACASLVVCSQAQVRFVAEKQEVIQARLSKAAAKNDQRKTDLIALFQEVGCAGHLIEQPVKGSKLPNIICSLPGTSDEVLIVGAHYDKVEEGFGAIDNWSGASLLPSIYSSLKSDPRHHTIVFIGFSDEEKGLVGSQFYVKSLKKEELAKVVAMVNMDTLGLSPTKVWASHADDRLTRAIAMVAKAMSLPVSGMNVDGVGSSDSESFRDKKIPSMTIHSLTSETLPLLHGSKDAIGAIKQEDYFQSYRLVVGLVAFLDQWLTSAQFKENNVGSKDKRGK